MGYRKLKKIILKITPNKIKHLFVEDYKKTIKSLNRFSRTSYSQEGEDLILERLFGGEKNGFFIDVGAHHPKRFSNTYKFYLKGWRGLNIDAMPGSMDLFNKIRPEDINLEIGVSKTESELTYYIFNEPALNTFSKEEAIKKNGLRNFKIIDERVIKTIPLDKILENNINNSITIDFMTIDVEGLDLEVLESNNWEKFKPTYILVEDLKKYKISDMPLKSDIYKTLENKGYEFIAKTFNTLFFKHISK